MIFVEGHHGTFTWGHGQPHRYPLARMELLSWWLTDTRETFKKDVNGRRLCIYEKGPWFS